MHDFCFTIPYGLLLVCGGLSAYITKGSVASLAGGAGSGLLLIIAGYLSLNAFGKRKNSYLALVLETDEFCARIRDLMSLLRWIHTNWGYGAAIFGNIQDYACWSCCRNQCSHDSVLSLQIGNWRQPSPHQGRVMI
ncbi:hypothetical protein V8G54_036785 [Vigna mungo]|uniref:Uncharacterized protein n=1 Tax=Vigna mungo TaxID=3915 RepID=A0AAQ3RET8_VIGMU